MLQGGIYGISVVSICHAEGTQPRQNLRAGAGRDTIGRDIGNRLVINDPEVSRRHARLTAQMGGYVIEDLGSTNGTFVDGQRLMGPHLLRPGQTVMFGEKIALAYEALGFDPNATLVGGASPQAAPPGPRETFRVEPSYESPAPPPARPEPPSSPAYTPAYPPAPEYQSPPSPAFTGQVPPGPSEPDYPDLGPVEVFDDEEEEAPGRSRTMMFAGCGVLVVMACCLVVGLFAFDYMNLYCQEPFRSLSGVLWSCTP
jgi:predicted component of type VI protein secretion system